jgi:hypothetical protein
MGMTLKAAIGIPGGTPMKVWDRTPMGQVAVVRRTFPLLVRLACPHCVSAGTVVLPYARVPARFDLWFFKQLVLGWTGCFPCRFGL